jgi:hypothetical protein
MRYVPLVGVATIILLAVLPLAAGEAEQKPQPYIASVRMGTGTVLKGLVYDRGEGPLQIFNGRMTVSVERAEVDTITKHEGEEAKAIREEIESASTVAPITGAQTAPKPTVRARPSLERLKRLAEAAGDFAGRTADQLEQAKGALRDAQSRCREAERKVDAAGNRAARAQAQYELGGAQRSLGYEERKVDDLQMLYRLRAESHRLAVEKVEQEVKCARTEEEARRAAELHERQALAAAEEERRKLERAQFDPGQTRPQPKTDETKGQPKAPREIVRPPPGIGPAEPEPILTRYFHLPARNPVAAVLVVVFYFLPFLIGLCRKHRNAVPIFIIDLFLGWTGLAWIGCLAWAFTANTRESAAQDQRASSLATTYMCLAVVGLFLFLALWGSYMPLPGMFNEAPSASPPSPTDGNSSGSQDHAKYCAILDCAEYAVGQCTEPRAPNRWLCRRHLAEETAFWGELNRQIDKERTQGR